MSSTEWGAEVPRLFNPFVDISARIGRKMQVPEAYALEMCAPPHSCSTKQMRCPAKLHRYCVSVDAAEAFMVKGVLG